MPTLKLNDVDMYYSQEGEGPDIVWIAGGDNVGEDWRYQVDAFKADFRNTMYDPRGAGQTTCSQPIPWSIEDFARDCAELIRATCKPPVYVVGLSMGSLIALQMAVEYPELVRCSIPMGTSARVSGYTKEWMAAEVAFRRAGGQISPDMAIAHYGMLMYPPEVLADDELWAKLRPFVADSYSERDGEMLAAQWEACVHYDVYDEIAECDIPIHVVAFQYDVQAPWPLGKEAAERAKNGHFHLLEGLGHLSMVGHKPDVVNECIRNIVESYE